ncbi:unnamed protein product [Brachionus calyciflorus]|uniref:Uncharacterized protein n=1 Tax=Brachionus calyciflorus TaxID=104777 RepID=A0A813MRY2_9BILA|nr:unnamed protein product [Brachionus calyciflorus]
MNFNTDKLIVPLIIFMIFSMLIPNQINCLSDNSNPSESLESNESDKFDLVYSVLKGYLLRQLDDLENFKKAKDDTAYRQKLFGRRQLKSQGLFERLKNKMDHDKLENLRIKKLGERYHVSLALEKDHIASIEKQLDELEQADRSRKQRTTVKRLV